ncbi:MAG: 3-isopropylmalate dehydratase small subunit, partial [Chloroflexota bacterium]
GQAMPLNRANVDTDQIIPAKYLKLVERTGFGRYLFDSWRKDESFVLNDRRYAGARVLIAGPNFGCGSSREHAPWALEDYGFKTIIAPSFADIFYNNCFKNGMLPVVLPEETVDDLLVRAKERPGYTLTVDLEKQTVEDEEGVVAHFEVDTFRRHCLLEGLDDIGLTLQHEADITAYERKRSPLLPVAV